MANEFYTLIVVPHAKARFRRVQVSVKFIKWASAISATLGLLLLISLVHYARIAVEVHELRRLRAENRALLTKTLEYEQNAGKLQLKLEYLQKTVMKLGVMAGLEQTLPDATVGGVGGVPSAESSAPVTCLIISTTRGKASGPSACTSSFRVLPCKYSMTRKTTPD